MIQAKNMWEAAQLHQITTVAACDQKINLLGEYVGRSRDAAEQSDWSAKIKFLKQLREQLQPSTNS